MPRRALGPFVRGIWKLGESLSAAWGKVEDATGGEDSRESYKLPRMHWKPLIGAIYLDGWFLLNCERV